MQRLHLETWLENPQLRPLQKCLLQWRPPLLWEEAPVCSRDTACMLGRWKQKEHGIFLVLVIWYISCYMEYSWYLWYYRRKFRSQTSDDMDRWKAEMTRVREEKRREEERRSKKRKSQKKEDPGARKGRKNHKKLCVFPMICCSGRSKSRLAKASGGCGASWRDERWTIARRCGAKHISKSKCTKHFSFGALLEVAMSKKCMPLWREAHFEVKMYKRKLRCRKSARRCGAKHISK